MTVIGNLVTKFVCDTTGMSQGIAQYGRDITALEKKNKDFNKGLADITATASKVIDYLAAASAGAGIAVGAISLLIMKATGFAEALTKASYATGLSVEQLQRWKAVGTETSVSFDDLAATAQMMTSRMGEVADPSSEMSKNLKNIGVSAYDANGKLKDTNTLMWDIIIGLSHQESGVNRNSKAMAILGKSWDSLAPIINNVADAQDAYNKADPFSDQKIATLDKYNTALEKAGAASERWAIVIGDKLTPLIDNIFIPAVEAAGNAVNWLSTKWDEMQIKAAQSILYAQGAISGDFSKFAAFNTANKGGSKSAASSTGSANPSEGSAPGGSNWAEELFGGESQGKIKTAVDLLDDVGDAMKDLKDRTEDVADEQKKLNDLTKKYAATQEDLDRQYAREMSMVDPRDASAVRNLMVNHQWNEEDLAIQQSRDTSVANEDIATAKGEQAAAAGNVAKKSGDLIININGKLLQKTMGVIDIGDENKSMGVPNR